MSTTALAKIRGALDVYALMLSPHHAGEAEAAIDAFCAIEAELAKYRSALDGVSQDALNGGWTARCVSDELKKSEGERKRLCLKVNALLDCIKEHASRAAQRRIHAAVASLLREN